MSKSFDKRTACNLRATYAFSNLPAQPKKKYFIKNIYKVTLLYYPITLLLYYIIRFLMALLGGLLELK